jgi:hypothetical protein
LPGSGELQHVQLDEPIVAIDTQTLPTDPQPVVAETMSPISMSETSNNIPEPADIPMTVAVAE